MDFTKVKENEEKSILEKKEIFKSLRLKKFGNR